MNSNEVINNIKMYVGNAIENLEYGMNVVECNNDFNDSQNEEIGCIYKKISSAIKILESI